MPAARLRLRLRLRLHGRDHRHRPAEPGSVRGWWGTGEADQEIGHAPVLLDSREHASEFAATVEQYVPDLRLRVVAVDVTASAP
ncbi:hypothetical protein [Micromonospora sp. S-DT3-3-22]|uniref:hypothetical protein n=1 Tax=Micromonospora sp. S-DT3-3-22 TaxID=2755359 RepID=UPI00188F67BF|nr:hypothetical protein [Micromonospora sp. S-DT3-3-22]